MRESKNLFSMHNLPFVPTTPTNATYDSCGYWSLHCGSPLRLGGTGQHARYASRRHFLNRTVQWLWTVACRLSEVFYGRRRTSSSSKAVKNCWWKGLETQPKENRRSCRQTFSRAYSKQRDQGVSFPILHLRILRRRLAPRCENTTEDMQERHTMFDAFWHWPWSAN